MARRPEDLLIQNMIDLAILRDLVAHIANEIFDRDRIARILERLDIAPEETQGMETFVDSAHSRILHAISADIAERAKSLLG